MSYIDELDKEMKRRFGGVRIKLRHGPVVDNVYYNVASGTKFCDVECFAIKNELRATVDRGATDVVIEMPRKSRKTILLENIQECDAYKKSKLAIPIPMGVDARGRPKICNLTYMPHLLVGGRVGSGKATFMNSMISSLVERFTPEQCKLVLTDIRGVTFLQWRDAAHLSMPIAMSCDDVLSALHDMIREIEARFIKLHERNAKNIRQYNQDNSTPMPYIVVFIDNYVCMSAYCKRDFETCIVRIVGKGATVGVHLVMATTGWLTGKMRAYFPTRITFQTRNAHDSKAILGERGAENLMCCGDALYSECGRMPMRIHTPISSCNN